MFIVFDGIDGSGKSTVLDIIYEKLCMSGEKVSKFKEPSTGPYGLQFRRIAGGTINPNFANSMLIKDRLWDVKNNIYPALQRGEIVLLDRYYYSHVYQATNIKTALPVIEYNRKKFPRPDMTLLFDVSPFEARRRILASRDGIHALERKLPHTRALYKHLTIYPEVRNINAARNLNEVVNRVAQLIN